MNGKLTYFVRNGKNTLKSLKLTVCSEDDMEITCSLGLTESRRFRISRLLHEALEQGARLSYRDLCIILLTSRATLKRDMRVLKRRGPNLAA